MAVKKRSVETKKTVSAVRVTEKSSFFSSASPFLISFILYEVILLGWIYIDLPSYEQIMNTNFWGNLFPALAFGGFGYFQRKNAEGLLTCLSRGAALGVMVGLLTAASGLFLLYNNDAFLEDKIADYKKTVSEEQQVTDEIAYAHIQIDSYTKFIILLITGPLYAAFASILGALLFQLTSRDNIMEAKP